MRTTKRRSNAKSVGIATSGNDNGCARSGGAQLAAPLTAKDDGITGMIWPTKLTPEVVRMEVDKACQKGDEATVREVLWVTTVELGAKDQAGRPPSKSSE